MNQYVVVEGSLIRHPITFSFEAQDKLTFFDTLNLLVVDGANRNTSPKDFPHMPATNVFCLFHNIAVKAGRSHVHSRFGTGQDAGTDGETAREVLGGSEIADIPPVTRRGGRIDLHG